MKKLLTVLSLLLFVVGFSYAQSAVSGTVTDDTGEPLIGTSILVEGTITGTVTDIDGKYTLNVPEGSNVLVFSYTGYKSQRVEINGRSVIDLVMETDAIYTEEVVVTGLGIKREKKALGYGVATITDKQITARQEVDVARLLRGKATGVDITQTSGLSGSGTNVIIRGYSSISGDNQPLFVIDGVPFNTSTNDNQGFAAGGATTSSRFLDLDPNNIAELSILKGLSATVLYGEAGRNGVILITTKNGSVGDDIDKGMEVSVTQSVSRSEVANIPDYQNTYGNGFNAGFGWYFSNWGAAFADTRSTSYGSDFKGLTSDGQVIITHPYDQSQYYDDFGDTYRGAEYIYQPYESVENFFEPGLTSNTSIAIENKVGESTAVSATYSYLSDEGFTPKLDDLRGNGASNYLKKHNFGLGMSTKLGNGIGVRGTFNYVNSARRVPKTGPAFGGDGNGLFAALLFTPRSMDLMNLPYQSPVDGSNVYYRRGSAIQNPRWVLNNAGDTEAIQRFFGTMETTYEFTPWLTALYRLGIDQYAQNSQRYINKGGVQTPDGEMESFDILNRITDQVLNLAYNFQLSDDWSLDGIVGANLRREKNEFNGTQSTQQFVYNLINHGNFIEHNAFSNLREENTIGVYGTATVGYKNYLYLNLQARNDWTSTLEQENRSILYPSASISFVPTDAFPNLATNNVLNYLKLRVGYGTSAGYPDPYQTRNTLNTSTNVFVTGGGNVLNTNSVSNSLGNRNLKPELHTELEGGVEARLLQNRIGIDLSLYNKNSSDLIVDLNLDPATGFTNTTVNAAEVENKGIELGVNLTPIRGDFQWDLTLNYTKNISEVKTISEGVDQIYVAGYTNLGNVAIPGEQYGVMVGSEFQKNENGEYIVDGQGNYQSAAGTTVIGNPNPNFTANWINNFSWKGFSFGFQWQYIDGGDIYSSTVQALLARGNTVDTDVDRNIPIIMPNSVKGDGSPNDIQTYMGDSFFRAYFFANEGGVFDATSIRLREVSLAYVFPQSFVDKTPFGRIGITLSGENLWYNAPNFPEGINFDPDISSLGVGNGRGFDFRTAPTVKKYGLTLNATF